MVEFPLAAAPEPTAPTEAELQRWYDNHPDQYSAPEYRRIKAVVLSPQTLAKDIPITDADLQAAYEQRKAQYVKPARRSAEVISVADEAKAKALAERWRDGADWAAMQKAAQDAGGSAIALDDASEREFPDADLARTVFAATPDTVTGPDKGALGWRIVRVTKVTPGSEQSFDEVKDALRERGAGRQGGRPDVRPRQQGGQRAGQRRRAGRDAERPRAWSASPARWMPRATPPMARRRRSPAPAELKTALIKAAFEVQKGDPLRLVEVPTPSTGGSAYYALSVEDVTPPAVKPFDTVKEQVAADWTRDVQRHAQEQAAAKLLAAVKGGQSLADAAAVAGVTVRRTPLIARGGAAEGMPPQLEQALFTLKQGEPTMVETGDGFIVAVPAEIVEADPKADPAGYGQVRQAVARSIGTDLASVFADALRARAEPRINQPVLDNVTGQQQ